MREKRVHVEPANKPFLRYKGDIKVGPGNIEEDIRKARKERARRYA